MMGGGAVAPSNATESSIAARSTTAANSMLRLRGGAPSASSSSSSQTCVGWRVDGTCSHEWQQCLGGHRLYDLGKAGTLRAEDYFNACVQPTLTVHESFFSSMTNGRAACRALQLSTVSV